MLESGIMEFVKVAYGNLCPSENHVDEIIMYIRRNRTLKIEDTVNPKTYSTDFFFRLNVDIGSVMDNSIINKIPQ